MQTSDELIIMLRALQTDSFALPACLPSYSAGIAPPEGYDEAEAYELSSVSMPPELYDVDEDRWQTGEGHTANLKLFANDVSWDRISSSNPLPTVRSCPTPAPRSGGRSAVSSSTLCTFSK